MNMNKFLQSTVDASNHSFKAPCKLVKSIAEMSVWERSSAYFELLGFILSINESIMSKSNTTGGNQNSPYILRLMELLNLLDRMIDKTPPVEQPQRFGNKAFRTWYSTLSEGALNMILQMLPADLHKAAPEIVTYLIDGFGNSTRIDYGTGHEISFIMFLCSLFKIQFLKPPDKSAAACTIFVRYLEIVRRLQQTYRMEPAGSHGVWSLDDYQFVPFIWGSAQLIDHLILDPASFLKDSVIQTHHKDFMFFSCIKYINEVKKGPFSEHSNQLWSISGVPSWAKINSGLIKMYKAEVLNKFPLVQHIVFGSLFTLDTIP